jgi:RNA polymerase sigma factor (sigma-70 family)
MALVREGHERAFEALVHRYRKPLSNYCRSMSLPEARAEDVLQQALLKAWLALREDTEVRDLKAWLYRVVHNTAVNAVRSADRDRDRLIDDPAHRAGASEVGLERGLMVREALAEVAALPEMQREVIVRTAVAGHSHEQVASDLGITDGAVRGLLYRARATLRTAATALTPPPLLNWIAGAASQGGSSSERLAGLTAGGGASFAGALARGGVAAITAATLVAGAAAVHSRGAGHRGDPFKVVSGGSSGNASGTDLATAAPMVGTPPVDLPARIERPHGRGTRGAAGRHGGALARIHIGSTLGSRMLSAPGSAPASQWEANRRAQGGAPGAGHVERSAAPRDAPAQGTGQVEVTVEVGGAGQSGGKGQAGGSAGAGPVGSTASDGSGGDGAEAAQGQGSDEASGGAAGGDESGAGSAGGSEGGGSSEGAGSQGGSGSQSGSGSQGGSGGSEASGGDGSGQSGSLVGTVVHEVGGLVEHLLH